MDLFFLGDATALPFLEFLPDSAAFRKPSFDSLSFFKWMLLFRSWIFERQI